MAGAQDETVVADSLGDPQRSRREDARALYAVRDAPLGQVDIDPVARAQAACTRIADQPRLWAWSPALASRVRTWR